MTDEEYLYDYLGFSRPSTEINTNGYNDSNQGKIHGQ